MTTLTVDSTLDTRLNLSPAASWTGRGMSALGVAFMLFDGGAKALDLIPPEVKAANSLGWPDDALVTVGVISLICTALYVAPRTAVLGAVLLTGYFGGAIASHVRVGSPLFSHTLFPVYVAALFWSGLLLRDQRARALIAPRKSA